MIFPFGETLHTITCAPLRQCDIQLQPGEKVNNVKIGDKVRWKIEALGPGPEGAETVHLVVKPTQARPYHVPGRDDGSPRLSLAAEVDDAKLDADHRLFVPRRVRCRDGDLPQEEQERQRRDGMSRVAVGEGDGLRVEDLDFRI